MFIFDENDEYFRFPGGALETPGTLRLRIKLMRTAAKRVRIVLYPDGCAARESEMVFAGTAGSYDVFECELHIEVPGLYWYRFLVSTADCSEITVPEHEGGSFQLTAYSPTVNSPDWIKGGMIYHIFVDRFRRGGEYNLREGAVFRDDWGGCPHYLPDEQGLVRNNDFFGGDFYGIIDKLPYLEDLGVTCLYLSPVFEAASNHKYDTGDFMHVDPAFGGDEAFELLCAKAGERGIKVILDGVFNHVGIDSRYFNKFGRYDSIGAFQSHESPYYDWFTFCEDGKYDAWWGIELLPAVNKSNLGYRAHICSEDGVIARWTKKGVSGWRLDVVDELPDMFLYPLCEAIKRENSGALIVGEVWEDASNKIAYDVRRKYFLGGQLDSVTNYPLKDAIITLVKSGSAQQLASTMAAQSRNYPDNVRHSLMNILGTHDTARILTSLSDAQLPNSKPAMEHFRLSDEQRNVAKRRLKLAVLLQFTLPGVPCVYYGDEAGMEGCADPFNRRCYPWDNEDKEILSWYLTLSKLRKSHSCFRDGEYLLSQARDGVFAFIRDDGHERILVAVNTTGCDRELVAHESFNYDLLKNKRADSLIVEAGGSVVYTIMRSSTARD